MSQEPRNDRAQGPAGGELLMACAVQFDAQAAGDGGAAAAKPRRFSMNAYTGGAMQLVGWRYPVVVDLTGLVASNKPKVFLEHDRTARVGHIDDVQVAGSALAVSGVVSASGRAAQEVLADAANGFPWQASIGARAIEVEWVPEGHSAQANGRQFAGPVNIARKAVLGEVSFVALGADDNTSAQIAAAEALPAATKETAMPQNSAESQTASTTPTAATITAAQDAPGQTPEQMRAATAAEMKRIAGIQKVAAKHADIAARAVEEGWDVTRAELEVLRADRPLAAPAHVPDNSVTDDLLLAAACQSGQLQGMEKAFDAKVLEAAHRRFHGRLGLQRLIMEAAWANGHVGRSFEDDRDGALRAAFSTLRLPGILQNIANKFLLAGFLSVENAWQKISATRSVRDFKAVTSYRMSGVTWDGKPGQIVLSADELAIAREFVAGQPKPALLFAPFAGPPPEQASRLAYIKHQGRMQRRSLPIDLAQKLADTLAANYTVLHARLPEQPQLNNTVAVVDHLRILAALTVVCPKRVLVDSFLQHAAAALEAPAVVCWSGTSPKLLGYDLHRNLVRQACTTPTCGRPNSHLFDMTAMDMPWTCPFGDACLNHPIEAILQAVEEEVPCGAEG